MNKREEVLLIRYVRSVRGAHYREDLLKKQKLRKEKLK